MIKRVIFLSRIAAENIIGWHDWAVISISEPNSAFGEAKLDESWFAIQRVSFHDTVPGVQYDEKHELMAEKHARKIVDFVRLVSPEIEGIVVNCKAGISRSAAVAKWIAATYDLPFNHSYGFFNKHVFSLLNEVSLKQ
jgi:predicted protein tyrosine phosphatase